MLIDAHNHMQDPRFGDQREAVLRRAREAGVGRMVLNGTEPKDWPEVRRMVEEGEGYFVAAFGVHPWRVDSRDEGWKRQLERHLDALPSAIGEIGLDRWIDPRDERAQERTFAWQMDLARERNLPVCVHCLRAWGWLQEVLDDHPPPDCGWMLHGFGGSAELVEQFGKLGAYFSFAGNVAEEKREKLREALREVPLERLLIETDAPDMLPPERLRRHVLKDGEKILNEPANLAIIRDYVAEQRDMDPAELERKTAENALRLFGGAGLRGCC